MARAHIPITGIRRRSSCAPIVIQLPGSTSVMPIDLEQLADETIQILVEKLAAVERERDELLAAAIQLVATLDTINESGSGYDLTLYKLRAMNRERDDAHEELRAAIAG